ncbi:hypothetical protein SAMN05216299_1321 [Nitrosospira sp. Nsp14]|uniref:hypothetical protein n=1 Tax=Nitrosospira sp. Nsp14 TaxID=1855333 RepID=UPI0008E94F84|nr:hypothetical protein [Nitrosospira sp. Nsp14]SFH60296.1 hypothetical protein SAMN05216299_1321 [Nitrosospira sp. Nsp14]
MELAEKSLKEVKALTEYEDQKAQRILTAVAFLATLGGLLFTLVCKEVPTNNICNIFELDGRGCGPISWDSFLQFTAYIGFLIFSLTAVIGSAFVIHAVAPRFNLSDLTKQTEGDTQRPKSFLFFLKILKVKREHWEKVFLTMEPRALRREYTKNAIVESYLIADKIRLKVKHLRVGVRFFFWSTVILALWILCAVAAIIFFK